jgi:hypothetical protein
VFSLGFHRSKREKSGEQKQAKCPVSQVILDLKPVTFRHKKDFDPKGGPQFGLVAEEIAKVDPDLVVADDQGKTLHRSLRGGECNVAE